MDLLAHARLRLVADASRQGGACSDVFVRSLLEWAPTEPHSALAMGHPARLNRMTAETFLQWEVDQVERHELLDGEPYAMAGAEDRHVTVSLNLAMSLRQHLRGSPCRTYMSDMKVQSAQDATFFYPDVLVTCSEADRLHPLIKREPVFIAEVLSPSTAAYDRGAKFAHYRRLLTLKEVAFIDLDRRIVDVYRRGPDDLWVLHPFEAGEAVALSSLDLTVPAEVLFAELEEPPAPITD